MASQSLQTIERGGAVALDDSNPYRGLERSLSTRIAGLKDALPKHIDPAKFQRTVMTAAQQNPDLLAADRASLITSCMKCAQDGLLPDGREAALVIYTVSKKEGSQWTKVKTVQYLPMVYGLRKKILQSGEISTLETNVVYRAEVESGAFIFEAGTEAMLRHRPMLDLDDDDITDDKIVAAYSVATMKDGSKSFEVMRRSEINKVRQASQTGATGKTKYNSNETIPPKGPWVDWFSEMARKTVMRRHSKTLPMSGDLIDMEGADEDSAARSAARLMEVEPDAPALAPPTREEVAAGDPPHDAETGEIVDEEEIARQLDRQSEAAMENRTEENADDEVEEVDPDAPPPYQAMVDSALARVAGAAILGDVLTAERDFSKHRDLLPEDIVTKVDEAIEAGRAKFKKVRNQ
jgi:recombination protein RecT